MTFNSVFSRPWHVFFPLYFIVNLSCISSKCYLKPGVSSSTPSADFAICYLCRILSWSRWHFTFLKCWQGCWLILIGVSWNYWAFNAFKRIVSPSYCLSTFSIWFHVCRVIVARAWLLTFQHTLCFSLWLWAILIVHIDQSSFWSFNIIYRRLGIVCCRTWSSWLFDLNSKDVAFLSSYSVCQKFRTYLAFLLGVSPWYSCW